MPNNSATKSSNDDRVILFHLTSQDGARFILDGLKSGDDDLLWLSPDPRTVCGESARSVLVEVTLRASDSAIAPYRRGVVEEEIDPVSGEVIVESELKSVPSYFWYEISVHRLRLLLESARIVIGEERRRLME